MRLEWLGGAAAIALLATMGSASAAPVSCGMGCVLNATFSPRYHPGWRITDRPPLSRRMVF